MKRLHRPELSFDQRVSLFASQKKYDSLSPVSRDDFWKKARQWKRTLKLVTILESMSGPRENCFYCGSSVATDIEHYLSRANFPGAAFRWGNWLWVCGQCNRQKSSSAARAAGQPGRILDPTRDDPWSHFFFDETTGRVEPRWVNINAEDYDAIYTLQVLKNLNSERKENQRRKVAKEIKSAIRLVLKEPNNIAAVRDLVQLVREDATGIGQWYFCNGAKNPNHQSIVAALREHHPKIWKACIRKAL